MTVMKKNDFGIDEKLCKEKAFQVGEIINGLTVPNILCILGTVIIELVVNARSHGYDIDEIFKGWLQSMIDRIDNMPDVEDDDFMVN